MTKNCLVFGNGKSIKDFDFRSIDRDKYSWIGCCLAFRHWDTIDCYPDIYVNVDFYSASLYFAMGIALDLYTPIFAISRVAGWTAHVIEEQFAGAAPKPVIYRPESEYVGDYCGPDECSFVPMSDR